MGKGGFSWKRATGITKMKTRVSRSTGVPLTRSGRQRKLGSILAGKGCLIYIVAGATIPAAAWVTYIII